jgi:hypothetical protein
MNLGGQLYKLQQIDLEVQEKRQMLNDVENSLEDDKTLVAAKSRLATQEQQLAETRKKQKGVEWELEDLQEKVKQVNHKLYNGKIRNPKELLNVENELRSLKDRTRKKEDEVLELMAQVEEIEDRVKISSKETQNLQQEWQERQETFSHKKTEIEVEIDELEEVRRGLAELIALENLRLYEQLRSTKGQAVARVERGRCQGCHIALPTSQWQRAKAGELVQCNNCSRILYME